MGNDNEELSMGGDAKGIERGIGETGTILYLYHTYMLSYTMLLLMIVIWRKGGRISR